MSPRYDGPTDDDIQRVAEEQAFRDTLAELARAPSKYWRERCERAEAALAVARQALDYCSYPSVGFPGGGGAAYDIFVRTSVSELNARSALAASAHCARAALSRLDEEAK